MSAKKINYGYRMLYNWNNAACIFLFFIYIGELISQKQASKWYFGDHAALDFSSGSSPSALTNNAFGLTGINTYPPGVTYNEGSSSIADPVTGNLLFYSDGLVVYDASHNPMPNGTGLLGGTSSTQSALIIPNPSNPKLFYVFTVTHNSSVPSDLTYSIVDMNLNGGLGDVATKNTVLFHQVSAGGPITEKLTAVHHCNKQDVWIAVKPHGTNKFIAFLVGAGGILDTVETQLGPVITGIGQMKFSPNGKKVAVANSGSMTVQLFDFNARTGKICNPVTLTYPGATYGISFSPDNTKLYVSSYTNFFDPVAQFDLTAANIQASRYLYPHPSFLVGGALQLAGDGKIYIAGFNNDTLDVINNPNLPGILAGYAANVVPLGGKLCNYGLPGFIESWFLDAAYTFPQVTASFLFDTVCSGTATTFTNTSVYNDVCINFLWSFGDPASGVNNFSSFENPGHVFSSPGTYTVSLTVEEGCLSSTAMHVVVVDSFPFAAVSAGASICRGDNVALTASGGSFYSWFPVISLSNGMAPNPTASPLNTVTYSVTVSNSCGVSTAVVTVIVDTILNPSIIPVAPFCEGGVSAFTIGAVTIGGIWSGTGITNASAGTFDPLVSGVGSHTVSYSLSNTCGIFDDNIMVVVNPLPVVSIVNDTSILLGTAAALAASGGTTYNWYPPGGVSCIYCQSPYASPAQTTVYYVIVSDHNGCTAMDSVVVEVTAGELFLPNAFSPNGDGQNDELKLLGNLYQVNKILLTIYNRWGEKVFETTNASTGWDGNYRGETAETGVYVYSLSILQHNDELVVKKGNITLLK